LKNTIYQLCDEAIMAELNLHPKFGLVTPLTNGSHKDMNYNLMIKAKGAIIPYFIKMFEETYNSNKNIKEIFENVRNIGIEAEKAMFSQTNGINAYKGLIFALGLVVTSIAIKLSNIKSNKTIFDYIKQMTHGITQELENGNDTSKHLYLFYNKQINVLTKVSINRDVEALKQVIQDLTDIKTAFEEAIRIVNQDISKTEQEEERMLYEQQMRERQSYSNDYEV
jgi:triphosphoribosyl-dephospho-CoA synthetase